MKWKFFALYTFCISLLYFILSVSLCRRAERSIRHRREVRELGQTDNKMIGRTLVIRRLRNRATWNYVVRIEPIRRNSASRLAARASTATTWRARNHSLSRAAVPIIPSSLSLSDFSSAFPFPDLFSLKLHCSSFFLPCFCFRSLRFSSALTDSPHESPFFRISRERSAA